MSEERIGGGKNRALQIAPLRKNGWTSQKREQFLDTLAETCNVQLAARRVGMCSSGPYNLRRRDPAFAAAWTEALRIGCEQLEAALLAQAIVAAKASAIGGRELAEARDGDGHRADPARPMTADEIKLSIFLLSRHQATADGQRGRVASKQRATREETNALLKRKLDALDRQMKAAG